jgi:hypothetical protein
MRSVTFSKRPLIHYTIPISSGYQSCETGFLFAKFHPEHLLFFAGDYEHSERCALFPEASYLIEAVNHRDTETLSLEKERKVSKVSFTKIKII